MRIICPHCHAAYDVPESRLESVLSLRCSACGHSWALAPVSAPIDEPDAPPEPPAPPPATMPVEAPKGPDPLVAHAPASDSKTDLDAPSDQTPAHDGETAPLFVPPDIAGRTVSARPTTPETTARNTLNIVLGIILLLLIFLAAVILARHGIMKWLPGSAKLFAMFGLA